MFLRICVSQLWPFVAGRRRTHLCTQSTDMNKSGTLQADQIDVVKNMGLPLGSRPAPAQKAFGFGMSSQRPSSPSCLCVSDGQSAIHLNWSRTRKDETPSVSRNPALACVLGIAEQFVKSGCGVVELLYFPAPKRTCSIAGRLRSLRVGTGSSTTLAPWARRTATAWRDGVGLWTIESVLEHHVTCASRRNSQIRPNRGLETTEWTQALCRDRAGARAW